MNKMGQVYSTDLAFSYPENRDMTISKVILQVILFAFLVYIVSNTTDTLSKYGLYFFIMIVVLQISSEIKNFFMIDEVVITNNNLILKKKKKISSTTSLKNITFKITINPIDLSNKIHIDLYDIETKKHLINITNKAISEDTFGYFIQLLSDTSNRNITDFQESTHNQLLSLYPENMDATTSQGEFIKYSHNAVFEGNIFLDKFETLYSIALIASIAIALYYFSR